MAKKVEKDDVSATVDGINARFGAGTIIRMSDTPQELEVVPSGNPLIDDALGVWGFPLGRIVEIWGAESSGKSTLCLQLLAQAQALQYVCAYVDAEHSFDPVYAETLGLDPSKLLVSQPDDGETGLEVVLDLCKSGAVQVVVVDSVAGLTPRAILQGDMTDSHVGVLARMMAQGLSKLHGVALKNNTLVVFTNQERETIGSMGYGPKTTQPGGRSLKFYASQRIELKKVGQIKRGEEVIGNKTLVKIMKNKVAPPFRHVEVEMIFGQGFSYEGAVLDMASKAGLQSKSGNWISVTLDGVETKLGNGREASREVLRDNPELAVAIHTAAKELLYG